MSTRPVCSLAVAAAVIPIALLVACERSQNAASSKSPSPGSETTDPRSAWCVYGLVTDAHGHPMAGVEVIAHCGVGTLHGTGRAETDAWGEYTLFFGPGFHFMNDEAYVHIQAATISPRKKGFFERNLHRQGDLLMADREPSEEDLRGWMRPECRDHAPPVNTVILPNEPKRVDFVMLPAASVRGRLVDSDGQPMPDASLSLDADELPPSSSVLAWMKTDIQGRFDFSEVPTGRPCWFSVRIGRDDYESARVTFDSAAEYKAELTWDRRGRPPLALTLVSGK